MQLFFVPVFFYNINEECAHVGALYNERETLVSFKKKKKRQDIAQEALHVGN